MWIFVIISTFPYGSAISLWGECDVGCDVDMVDATPQTPY